ncbi:hypothetical protein [Sphingomonas turrisvirgatae]|uniref:hypothetical protein n=1 Tax=Sphingomonas turrisvirgatae TaxID=1888892 RepID=UPI0013015CD4|nr:hypothetical protein [Sphingomonas turrisvirgatae]
MTSKAEGADKIGVGIVGASASRGSASVAHIPAISVISRLPAVAGKSRLNAWPSPLIM